MTIRVDLVDFTLFGGLGARDLSLESRLETALAAWVPLDELMLDSNHGGEGKGPPSLISRRLLHGASNEQTYGLHARRLSC
jgi:hypothetical protein